MPSPADIPRVRRYGATPGETFAREGLKPSARQVYAIAREALELLELDYPSDRRAASELLSMLRGQRAAVAAVDGTPAPADDGIPF